MLLDTPICNFGWKAPDFVLNDPSGQSFRMSDHLGEKGLLVAFICNHCPYVKAIADRLAADMATLMAEGVNVLAVMSNDYRAVPADAPTRMQAFAAQHGFTFPYLVDESQQVARRFDAVCTPDIYVYDEQRRLAYHGRIDDSWKDEDLVTQRELEAALQSLIEGRKPLPEQHPSMGCSIKWRD